MTAFIQNLLATTPTFICFVVLFYMIRNQGTRMQQGFKNVDNEFKLVRSEMEKGFLKVNHHLSNHDREIKQIKKIKKQLKKLDNKVASHHLLLVSKLDQSQQR